MAYVSAHFIEITAADGTRAIDQQVVAVDEAGDEWFIPIPHEECQVGDWLRFVEQGGTVRAFEAVP
jgi:hypothetical protein